MATPITFIFTAPLAVWTIEHNLGVYPIVDTMIDYNGALTKIIPKEVIVTSLNTVEIHFSVPRTGQARVV